MPVPITPDHIIYDLPSLGTPRISPDGTRIAYVRSQPNRSTGKNDSQIWMCNIDGSNRRRLTWTNPRNADPVWSPDGARIAFATSHQGKHSVALLAFDGTDTRTATTHDTLVSNLIWSPDGSTLAYTKAVDPDNPNEAPRDPNASPTVHIVTRIDYKQDGYGFLNEIRNQVFVVDVDSGSRRQVTHAAIDHLRPAWSPDGRTLAVQLPNRNGLRSQFGLIDVANGAMTLIGSPDGAVGLFAWSPDGMQILFDGAVPISPHHDYAVHDVATGTTRWITHDVPFLPDVGYQSGGIPGDPIWLDDETALVHGLLHGGSGIWQVNVTSGETTQVGYWPAIHSGFGVSSDGNTIVQTSTGLGGTIGLATIDRTSGEKTLLFNEGDAFFSETPLAAWELVSIERDGFTIEGWLLKPNDFDEKKTYPLILDVHGGPHNAYGYGINGLAEVFATNGFFVLLPNPRGSGTYGRAFAEAVNGDWGNEDWKDLEAILDHVLKRPYIDKERTGIYGYSYGGYMTAWVIGHTNRFKGAICGAPVFDFESIFGQSDIGHTRGTGETPWEARAYLESRSPATHIQNATTPTLIIQGEADDRCPVEQSEQLFVSLMKLGVETEFIRYPGGSHLFVNNGEPSHRIDHIERSLAWFTRFLNA